MTYLCVDRPDQTPGHTDPCLNFVAISLCDIRLNLCNEYVVRVQSKLRFIKEVSFFPTLA